MNRTLAKFFDPSPHPKKSSLTHTLHFWLLPHQTKESQLSFFVGEIKFKFT
jgi:hypothetical protein